MVKLLRDRDSKPGSAQGWAVVLALLGGLVAASLAAADSTAENGTGGTPLGVLRPQLAWQHWVLNCQGCHRMDGSGSVDTAPALAGLVAKFTNVRGGRQYLASVPGVATAPLSDADLAELLNWILWRFDRSDLSADFRPYTAEEIGALRKHPLRTEASAVRARLMSQMHH